MNSTTTNFNPSSDERVLSIRDLNQLSKVKIELKFSLSLNLRSIKLLMRQGDIYYKESDLIKSYIYYMKVANLIIREIPKHPEYNNSKTNNLLKEAKKDGIKALERLEIIKPILEERYKEYINKLNQWKYTQFHNRREEESKDINGLNEENIQRNSNESISKQNEINIKNNKKQDYDPNWSVADALPNFSFKLEGNNEYNLRKQLEIEDNSQDKPYDHVQLLMKNHLKQVNNNQDLNTNKRNPISAIFDVLPSPPPIPPKELELINENKKVKESNSSFMNIYYNESGLPLRKINLNPKLIDQFLKIANENTINNIETCGLLSGSLIHNEFYLKSLIIPEQIGTSDSCIMINEEKWYHLIDENEWLLLGWIHTHPTQSCFLSSVDLHTHYPFQLMLSESIAIVCSPKFQPNFGTFRLTDPPGMPIISNCKEKSMFHPHEIGMNDKLFIDCNQNVNSLGHVNYNNNNNNNNNNNSFEIIDLRINSRKIIK